MVDALPAVGLATLGGGHALESGERYGKASTGTNAFAAMGRSYNSSPIPTAGGASTADTKGASIRPPPKRHLTAYPARTASAYRTASARRSYRKVSYRYVPASYPMPNAAIDRRSLSEGPTTVAPRT